MDLEVKVASVEATEANQDSEVSHHIQVSVDNQADSVNNQDSAVQASADKLHDLRVN